MEVIHTVICFVSISAKFGIYTVVGVNGLKYAHSSVPSAYFGYGTNDNFISN